MESLKVARAESPFPSHHMYCKLPIVDHCWSSCFDLFGFIKSLMKSHLDKSEMDIVLWADSHEAKDAK